MSGDFAPCFLGLTIVLDKNISYCEHVLIILLTIMNYLVKHFVLDLYSRTSLTDIG